MDPQGFPNKKYDAIFFSSGALDNHLGQLFAEKIKRFNLHKTAKILFMKEIMNFEPPEKYSIILKKQLENVGIPPQNIKILPGYGAATAKEIETAIEYLRNDRQYDKIYVAGIWWHTPRIALLWLK